MGDTTDDDTDWDTERNAIHSAVAQAISDTTGDMLLNTVVIAVTINDQGEKVLSCWTSPDQRLWETIGLVEYVRMDHGAHLAERRIIEEDP